MFNIQRSTAQLSISYTKSSYIGNYNIHCHGGNDGSIHLTVSGGYSPYTFHWNTNATTEDISNLVAGTYSVIVTDDSSNTDTISNIILVQPNALSIDFGKTNVSCHGNADGRIAANVSGGTPSYTYLWSTNQTVSEIMNLAPGNYSITITDANNCTASNNTTITEPPSLSLSLFSPINSNGFNVNAGLKDGTIDLTVTGGTSLAGYNYQWSSGDFTQDLDELDQGTYYVQVLDDHHCGAMDSITLSSEDSLSQDIIAITTRGNWLNPNEDFIGTRNTAALRLTTHNVERMRIDENGNVGIGTINPMERLAVNGNAKISGTLNVSNIPAYQHSSAPETFKLLMVNGQGEVQSTSITQSFAPCSQPEFINDAFWNTWSSIDDPALLPPGANSDMVFLCHPKLVGIGTDLPQAELDVHGNALVTSLGIGTVNPSDRIHIFGAAPTIRLQNSDGSNTILTSEAGAFRIISNNGVNIFLDSDNSTADSQDEFVIRTNDSWSGGNAHRVFAVSGNGEAYLCGGMHCGKIKVEQIAGCDFVFDEQYNLMPLPELEKFINLNKHLPEIPSVKEMESHGSDIGEMQSKLLQKVEELTLHMIDLKKENEALKTRIQILEQK